MRSALCVLRHVRRTPSAPRAAAARLSTASDVESSDIRAFARPTGHRFTINDLPTSVKDVTTETKVNLKPRVGNDWVVNIALCGTDVIPKCDVYYQIPAPGVFKMLGAAEKKTIEVDAPSVPLYVVGGNADHTISRDNFKALLKLTTDALGANVVFMNDGWLGSHREDHLGIRTVSSHPATSLMSSYVMHRPPLRNPVKFDYGVTVYMLPDVTLDSPETYGLNKEHIGSCIVCPESGKAIMIGTGSSSMFRACVHAASQAKFASNGALLLPGDYIKSGDRSVAFSAPLAPTVTASLKGEITYSTGGHLLSDAGVSRCLSGVTVADDGHLDGDIVENTHIKDAGRIVTRDILGLLPNVVATPSAVVLVCDDAQGTLPTLAKLTPAQAAFFFVAGFQSQPAPSGDAGLGLRQLAEDLNLPVFLLNAQGEAADNAVEQLVSGKLGSASKGALGLDVIVPGKGDAQALKDVRGVLVSLVKQRSGKLFDEVMEGAPSA